MHIDDTALDLWKQDQLTEVETSLTAAIATPQESSHHLLATRALIRARTQEWDAAIIDADSVCVIPRLSTRILTLIYIKAIETHPCIIAYIAKSLALVGKGDTDDGYRTCDIAFAPFQSSHASFLLLIKVGDLQSRVSYLLIPLTRPSSSFWPENTVTRYRV